MSERPIHLRAHPLIDRIYAAAVRPAGWNAFLEAVATELGDPAIVLNIELPNLPGSARTFRIRSEDQYGEVFADLARRGELPWDLGPLADLDRFVWSRELLSDDELEKTPLYRTYMEPQGLVAPGQLGHVIAAEAGRPVAAIGIYRREGGRPITEVDKAMLDLLVPHLRRAYALHCELRVAQHRLDVVSEAIDRFPTGVLFVDRDLRVVDMNRAAARIAGEKDGFTLRDGVPEAIASVGALDPIKHLGQESRPAPLDGVFSIERPSGRRPYEALVAMLWKGARAAMPRQPVAAVFIADPDEHRLRRPEVLRVLHHLTPAELELASLLTAGRTVEEAAAERDITVNTARSQLKRIFAKTGVSRQTELVRLLSAGIAGLAEQASEEDER